MTADQIPDEEHQGFSFAQPGEAPTGTVLLVEPYEAHEQFLKHSPSELIVLLRINHVRTLLDRGETAESYFGEDTTVITTTTIHDRRLSNLDWVTERNLILEFQPDFHIPCDYPVYKDNDPEKRYAHVRRHLKGMIWMARELPGTTTRILPLIKGETLEERRLCYQVYDHFGIQYCVFYGTQYFTASVGFYPLLEDLREIAAEAPHLKIMLIGLQSPVRLEQVPPQIVTAAGQRWINHVQLRDAPHEESQERFITMEQQIDGALGHGQMPLQAWTTEEVTG